MPNQPTSEEIQAMRKADMAAREARAGERIKQVLAEERCMINPVFVLTIKGVQGRIEIAAVE